MKHKALIIWFTGLSGAGKSTLAQKTSERLRTHNLESLIIDGDHVRNHIHKHLTFSREDILENNRLVAELCVKSQSDCDVIFVPIISPYRLGRQKAREIIGAAFREVYIKAPLDVLKRRDTKGLYEKHRNGQIDNLIGVSASNPYEEPLTPDLIIQTDREDERSSVDKLGRQIEQWLKNPAP